MQPIVVAGRAGIDGAFIWGEAMAIWKAAATCFDGSTQSIRALKGRRVRTRTALLGLARHDPATANPRPFDVAAGTEGFVGFPHADMRSLLVVFPNNPASMASGFDALARSGEFRVAVVNGPTFKLQFEVAT
ncbi:MAG: hypothetical protein U1F41_05755 [Burkholderiales bacterium]